MFRLEDLNLNLCLRNGEYDFSMGNWSLEYYLYFFYNRIIFLFLFVYFEGNIQEDFGLIKGKWGKKVLGYNISV